MSEEIWRRINQGRQYENNGTFRTFKEIGGKVLFYAGSQELELRSFPITERLAVIREAGAVVLPLLEAVQEHAPDIQKANTSRILSEENEQLQAMILKLQWGKKFELTQLEQEKIKKFKRTSQQAERIYLPYRILQSDYREIALSISPNVLKIEHGRTPELFPISFVSEDPDRLSGPLVRALKNPKQVIRYLHKGIDYWRD